MEYLFYLTIFFFILSLVIFVKTIIFCNKKRKALDSLRENLNKNSCTYGSTKRSFDNYCDSRRRALDKESENIRNEWQKIAIARKEIKDKQITINTLSQDNSIRIEELSNMLTIEKQDNDCLSSTITELRERLSNAELTIAQKDEIIMCKDSEIEQIKKALEQANEMRQIDKDVYDYDRSHSYYLMLSDSPLYKYISDTFMYSFLHNAPIVQPRLINYINDLKNHPQYNIKSIDISAQIIGSNDNIYTTTLNGCTCQDFKYKKGIPCKHMFRLAHELAMFNDLPSEEIDRAIHELVNAGNNYHDAIIKYDKKY